MWNEAFTLSVDQLLTVTLTLFAIIDIIGAVPILVSMKSRIGEIHAGKATLASGLLMVGFLAFGSAFLSMLGVDVKSFAVAGSIVIFIMAIEWYLGLSCSVRIPRCAPEVWFPLLFPSLQVRVH